MSFPIKIQWKGIDEFQRVLDRASSELRVVVDIRLGELAEEVVSLAKHYVPVRTGRLRDSIGFKSVKLMEHVIEALAEYAGFVEFGTSKMRAQPYMRPALDEVAPKMTREIMRDILKYLGSELRRLG